MNSIFASKMYKNSSHKSKIDAALKDPLNKELIVQISKYLDDEYQEPEYLDKNYNENSESDNIDSKETSNTEPEIDNVDTNNNNDSLRSELNDNSDSLADELDNSDELDESDDSDNSNNSDASTDSDNIVQTTKVSGSSIQGQTVLYPRVQIEIDKLSDAIHEIKGMLNSRSDTCGVNRVSTKDNELWIYYEDKINLNNVMTAVVEILSAATYSYLEFNRLARTDNAIVFEVNISNGSNN